MTGRFKAREDRRKVLIKARMREGSRWSDVCVLNMSSRGLGLQAADPPVPGSYIEVRRGAHVVIARVAWARSHRFGVATQDLVPIDTVAEDAPGQARKPTRLPVERRSVPRLAVAHEQSRWRARAMEFACLVVGGGVAAVLAFGWVETVLAEPLARVDSVLASGSAGAL
ncbi:hypothetical protein ACFQPG_06805 [Sphingomonas sp. GCM10030256]|uniref:hypothetical protein n=1 Tax=Sphingomonas sp. GCM10030256 TaxID=3273427 RepID=UPI003607E15D